LRETFLGPEHFASGHDNKDAEPGTPVHERPVALMYASTALAGDVLSSAIDAAQTNAATLLDALDALPAPIYVTDAQGVVTHFNRACVGFAGREPVAGKDRWCVTWKLFTDDGKHLPHDACPMAVAIKTGRPIRGVTAVAERPDGTRVSFMPFPTPIFEPSGRLRGAVNMLIDVTELRQIADLHDQAARCRRLARACTDRSAAATLSEMASEYDAESARLERASACPYVEIA
jgi:PAS domain S-box-containing protein